MQLHNHEQKVNTKELFKISEALFRNIVNTLNYSNATNRNEHAFQLRFVPLESIIGVVSTKFCRSCCLHDGILHDGMHAETLRIL